MFLSFPGGNKINISKKNDKSDSWPGPASSSNTSASAPVAPSPSPLPPPLAMPVPLPLSLPLPLRPISEVERKEKMMTLSRKFGASRLAIQSMGVEADVNEEKPERGVRTWDYYYYLRFFIVGSFLSRSEFSSNNFTTDIHLMTGYSWTW